ncbi:hypothetical protein JXL19_11295 [bacterium]|nr:hypothetical protein [bacterium]
MKRWKFSELSTIGFFCIFAILLGPISVSAGPFGYGGGYEIYPGIYKDDPDFIHWATGYQDYNAGSNVYGEFMTPEKALGKAAGDAYDIVSLGRGGSITMTFDVPICDGSGWDFAVFENSFSDTFLELAYVEVSTNGTDFVRFPNCSLTPSPVSAFGTIDPTNIIGLAGKYMQGYGTPFDLKDLAGFEEVKAGIVDLSHIFFVRIIDIVGDGTCHDNRIPEWEHLGWSGIIYDPYPTVGSAGFDLEAIGVAFRPTVSRPEIPMLVSPEYGDPDVPVNPVFNTGDFSDPDPDGLHLRTQWQISDQPDFTYLVFELKSALALAELTLKGPILQYGKKYYWRVMFYDETDANSPWSLPFFFTTTDMTNDTNLNGIPDLQELEVKSHIDLDKDMVYDVDQIDDRFKCLNTIGGNGQGQMGIKSLSEEAFIKFVESVKSIDIDSIADQRSVPEKMPLGLLSFRLEASNGSNTVKISVYFSEPASGNALWYMFDSRGSRFFPIDIKTGEENACFSPDRRYITLTLKDGGAEDMDGAENGIIVGLGGQGYFLEGESGGIGDLNGCFIKSLDGN